MSTIGHADGDYDTLPSQAGPANFRFCWVILVRTWTCSQQRAGFCGHIDVAGLRHGTRERASGFLTRVAILATGHEHCSYAFDYAIFFAPTADWPENSTPHRARRVLDHPWQRTDSSCASRRSPERARPLRSPLASLASRRGSYATPASAPWQHCQIATGPST
jgi:hypothetical protein